MSTPPDLDPLRSALTALEGDLRARLAESATEGQSVEWGAFAGELARIGEVTRFCREASVLLARRHGRSWRGLQADTGVADATLDGRVQRLIEREGL